MAAHASEPGSRPSRQARRVLMIGVKGWCSANQASPAGIDSVGTKPLDRNGSRMSGSGALLAASTLPLASPSATLSHVTAQPIIRIVATAPTQPATDPPPR